MKKKTPKKKATRRPTKKMAARRPKRLEGDELYLPAVRVTEASTAAHTRLEPLFLGSVINELDASEGRKMCYAIKSRIKPATDIIAKVERKRWGARPTHPDWSYGPEHVTDGCGFRVVTLFQEDLIPVVTELIKMFRHEQPYTDNPILADGGFREAVIYTNRPLKEEESIHFRVAEMLNAAGFKNETMRPQTRKSGYSSVHFVVLVQVEITGLPGRRETVNQAVEIQVRDVFEEAWSEIDHTLRYVNDRDGFTNSPSDNWKPHLNALKAFADGCSQHASLIKTSAIDNAKVYKTITEHNPAKYRLPSEKPKEAAKMLKTALPEKFHDALTEAFAAEARAAATPFATVMKKEFRDAANRFQNLITATRRYGSVVLVGRDVAYWLNMEYAYCLQPETDEERKKVIRIYEAMRRRYSNDTFACYRYGIALQLRGDFDRAQDLLEQGLKHLETDDSLASSAWIRAALPRGLGGIHWQRGLALRDRPEARVERLKHLEAACDETAAALDAAAGVVVGIEHDEYRKALNNLTYYLYEYLGIDPAGKRGKITKAILEKRLKELEKATPKVDLAALHSMHTIMVVRQYLKQTEAAKNMANAILTNIYRAARRATRDENLRMDQMRKHLHSKIHHIHDDAYRLLFAGLPPAKGRRKQGKT